MAYPTTIDTFPSSATLAGQDLDDSPHSTLHGNLGVAVAALEAKVGVNSSAVTTSHDYLLANVWGIARPINTQTGTSYTLVAADAAYQIHCDNASPFTLTIPSNASVPYTPGIMIPILNKGAGQVTVQITSDTLNAPLLCQKKLLGQGSWAFIAKTATTTWYIEGALETRVRTVVPYAISDPLGAAITTGDGKAYFRIPSELGGYDLVDVAMSLDTASSSGIPTVQLRRKRSGSDVDMLSTKLTIDASETDSTTAATPAVINTSNDDVQTADRIYFDIDVAGTGAKGLNVTMVFS